MFLLIDNYDSFTYNLYHFLGELGARLTVKRNDALTVAEAMDMAPQGIILSPGPCTPNEAGICLELIKAAAGKIPVLGVCLGHQAFGQAFIALAMSRLPAPFTSVALLVQPFLAIMLGWIVLDEAATALQFVGGLVVLAGILVSRRYGMRRPTPERS